MINVFNSNYEEVGSLNKNLALHTLGKIKIRYGRKYIDLLNDKGEINVTIPKILDKKDSVNDIKKDGFYIVDGNLYAFYKGTLYQLTGEEGDYISFSIEQNLIQEQIDIAQKNIGLKFPNLNKVTINKGIVFIDDRIYYKEGDYIKELTLKEPLSSINEANLGTPNLDNVAIVFKNGLWQYSNFVTLDLLDKLKLELPLNNYIQEEDDYDEIFDPVQYSKVYTIRQAELNYSGTELNKILTITPKTIPLFDLTDNDVAIISFEVYKFQSNIINITDPGESQNILYAIPVNTTLTGLGQEIKYEININRDILTLNFKIDSNVLKLCDKDGILINNFALEKDGYLIPDAISPTYLNLINYGTGPVTFLKIENNIYVLENIELKKRHIYIKAETVDTSKLATKEKFKIDYAHAEIALEENTPGNPLSIIPHTVLGDLDDSSNYYTDEGNAHKSFRTYTDKLSKQGLYSDLPVFTGAEFRGTWPDEVEVATEEAVYNFPRYSLRLNEDLCINHPANEIDITDPTDFWRQVIPTIEWIKRNGAMLNRPLRDINEENTTNLPETPTTTTISNITPVSYLDSDLPPIAIVYKNGHWTYDYVVPMSWFLDCCNGTPQITIDTPVISGTTPFTDSTNVTITCATEGVTIRYTTDGTDPTNSSTLYTNAFTINTDTTVKAIAYKDLDVSSVTSKLFTKIEENIYTLKFYYIPNNPKQLVEYIGQILVNQGQTANLSSIGIPNFTNYNSSGWLNDTASNFEATDAMNKLILGFGRFTGSSNTPMKNLITFDLWHILNSYEAGFYFINRDGDNINWNTFSDWESLDTEDSFADIKYNIADDKIINFFARWKAITYNVTYNFDGGTLNNESQHIESVIINKKPTWGNNNSPTKSDYSFVGWGETADSTNEIDLDDYSITLNIVFYAIWLKIYIAEYDFKGGFYNGSRTYRETVVVGQHPTWGNDHFPTKDLWVFDHWDPDLNTITRSLNDNIDETYIDAIYKLPVNIYYTLSLENGNYEKVLDLEDKDTYEVSYKDFIDKPFDENRLRTLCINGSVYFTNLTFELLPVEEGGTTQGFILNNGNIKFIGGNDNYSVKIKVTFDGNSTYARLLKVWTIKINKIPEVKIDSSLSYIPTAGGNITFYYWVDDFSLLNLYISNIYLSGLYKNIDTPTKVGNPSFNTSTKKWEQLINFSLKTNNNLGVLSITANYEDLISNSLELTLGGEILNLGDFDYMLFTFNFSNNLDLDNVIKTYGTNKSTTIDSLEYYLDDLYGGYMSKLEGSARSENEYEVYLNLTNISGDNTLLLNFIYQYLVYSGDNMFSGGEETCINWRNIINNHLITIGSGLKYICIYIICKWFLKSAANPPTLNDVFSFNYSVYRIKDGYRNNGTYFYKPSGQFYFFPNDLNGEYTLNNRDTYFNNNNGKIEKLFRNNQNYGVYENCTMNPNVNLTGTYGFNYPIGSDFIQGNSMEDLVNFTIYHNLITGTTEITKGYFNPDISSESSGSFTWNN